MVNFYDFCPAKGPMRKFRFYSIDSNADSKKKGYTTPSCLKKDSKRPKVSGIQSCIVF